VELTVPINIHFNDVCFLRQSSLEFADGFVPIFTQECKNMRERKRKIKKKKNKERIFK
jgi:hypothetical protein